jgi:hypothetical protein
MLPSRDTGPVERTIGKETSVQIGLLIVLLGAVFAAGGWCNSVSGQIGSMAADIHDLKSFTADISELKAWRRSVEAHMQAGVLKGAP